MQTPRKTLLLPCSVSQAFSGGCRCAFRGFAHEGTQLAAGKSSGVTVKHYGHNEDRTLRRHVLRAPRGAAGLGRRRVGVFLGETGVCRVSKKEFDRPLRAAGKLRPRRCRALCSARL